MGVLGLSKFLLQMKTFPYIRSFFLIVLTGLKHLVYISENHTNEWRAIVNEQHSRKEKDYPVAVAGINLSQMLFQIVTLVDTRN